MAVGNFAAVRAAFASGKQPILQKLGVQLKANEPKGDWWQVCCPVCTDTSGSASLSVSSGYLICHQCGEKADLFNWWKRRAGLGTAWAACKDLAEQVGVQLKESSGKKRGRMPPALDLELLHSAIYDLLESPDAESLRQFMAARNCFDPEILERFGIGYIAGRIVFAQWGPNGALRGRYRSYDPQGGNLKWIWSKSLPGSHGAVGFWPYAMVPKGAAIWLLEGEWDVLTAWIVMRLQGHGIYCFTWTGGAGSPIPAHMIPESWWNREIHICYDNDTFQGPEIACRAPSDVKRQEMVRRRKNLVSIAENFAAQNCTVYLRAVPIDPLKQWGADFRDWVAGGGTDLAELSCYPLSAIQKEERIFKPVTFNQLFGCTETDIRSTLQVSTIQEDVLSVPRTTCVECPAGTKSECAKCQVPTVAPNGILDWAGREHQLAECLLARDQQAFIINDILQKPRGCNQCRVYHKTIDTGANWQAMPPVGEENEGGRALTVVSHDLPPLSGSCEVEGTVYAVGKSSMLFATRIRALERELPNLQDHGVTLRKLCPTDTNSLQHLDDYLRFRAADLAANVTRIYGREDIHLALELTFHSALWFDWRGRRRRGWLDCMVIGDTRTGKSAAASGYINHLGLGYHQTVMDNYSRAGLTLGLTGTRDGLRMRPGLWPRQHGKAMVIDEVHHMVASGSHKEHLFTFLQSARDQGRVEGVKIYGSQQLPAAVRTMCIANWWQSMRTSFNYPIEHLRRIYGPPECLSRLDFAVPVLFRLDDARPEEVEHVWTRELMRVLTLRAWAQEPEHIAIDEKAEAYADQVIAEWADLYHEDLPLYTRKEKAVSLLRMAIAVANLSFSAPVGMPMTCHVRKVHVEWAAEWMRQQFHLLGYDAWSERRLQSVRVHSPWELEALLAASQNIEHPQQAIALLNQLFGNVTPQLIDSLYILDAGRGRAAQLMLRYGMFEVHRDGDRHSYVLTEGGSRFLQNMIDLAENHPEHFARRARALRYWWMNSCRDKHNITGSPLNTPLEVLHHEWNAADADSDGGASIRSISEAGS